MESHVSKDATAPAARNNDSAGMPHATAPVPANRILKAVVAPKKLTSDRERGRAEDAKLFCSASLCDQRGFSLVRVCLSEHSQRISPISRGLSETLGSLPVSSKLQPTTVRSLNKIDSLAVTHSYDCDEVRQHRVLGSWLVRERNVLHFLKYDEQVERSPKELNAARSL